MSNPTKGLLTRFKEYLKDHHQRLANYTAAVSAIATVGVLIVTVHSLDRSAQNLEKQLKEQRRTTSLLIASQFMINVGDGLTKLQSININDSACNKQCPKYVSYEESFHRFLVTRTQLLIDSLSPEFPALVSQILKFLGSNKLGGIFSVQRGFESKKFIELKLLPEKVDISEVEFSHPMILCANISGARLRASKLLAPTIRFSDMSNSDLISANLESKEDWLGSIYWSDLSGSMISSFTAIAGTDILFSDLRNLSVHDDVSDIDRVNIIAGVLRNARTLYGSILDEDVDMRLSDLLKHEYDRIRNNEFWALKISSSDSPNKTQMERINEYKDLKSKAQSNWKHSWDTLREANLNCKPGGRTI